MTANAHWPEFRAKYPDAVNTTIGVILDSATMMPWQPKVVVQARLQALEEINRTHAYGYQTQIGHVEFLEEAAKLTFGVDVYNQTKEDIRAYQSLGGTGALFLAKETLCSFMTLNTQNVIPLILDSGWPNHPAIFTDPFRISSYVHSDQESGRYNHQAALTAIEHSDEGSVLLLQTCGYNDDGADRTVEEWDEILDLAEKTKSVLVLDSAYMGLANGFEIDRYPIVQALKRGLLTFVCVSFSKNMGLYNERLGALFIVNAAAHIGTEQSYNLHQLVMRIVRRTISSQPLLAAAAAAKTLQQTSYYDELEAARQRIVTNRQALADQLVDKIPHVAEGKGLFTKLLADGFSTSQLRLLEERGILMLPNSRVNLGGMQLDQAKRVGAAIAEVLG